MKFATAWWGVQILAESDEDERLLRELLKRLPAGPVHLYEEGTVMAISPEDAYDDSGFDPAEVAAAPLVIEFRR